MALVDVTAFCLGTALFGLGLLHVYWGLGGLRYRRFATPRRNGRATAAPSGAAFFTVAGALWAAALLATTRVTGIGGIGLHGAVRPWLWIFAGLFAMRALGDFRLIGFFCRAADADHRRAEREFTAPLCILLSTGFVRLALLP